MNPIWFQPRLRSWLLTLVFVPLLACQESGSIQDHSVRPGEQRPAEADSQKDQDKDSADAEKITPPSNIIGSYLVCVEQETLAAIQQNARLNCGVYRDSARTSLVPVTNLNQWQLSDATAAMRSISSLSASVIELQFQAVDISSLRQLLRKARLSVQDDAGNSHQGFIADLLPADSRLSSVNATKTAGLAPVWSEGFEGTAISTDTLFFHDPKSFAASTTINWANPGPQTAACGSPVFEVMRFAIQAGSTDSIGAAEGQQFIDTDSACWPPGSANAIRGASNLSISKSLTLQAGRVYRVSFKVRQQPLPPSISSAIQGLQIRINGKVLGELRSFTSNWQEQSLEWVAASGPATIEWVDIGAADDSLGVLLDDLKVQVENF